MEFTYDVKIEPTYIFMWLTVLTKEYAPLIIQDLIDMGHDVGSIKPGQLTLGENPKVASVIAVKITYNCSFEELSKDISRVLKNNKVLYYSVVIFTSEGALTWGAGNMQIVNEFDAPPNSKKPRPTHLRLIENKDTPLT